ncbi:MAG TPA: hypothetical protein DCZ95_12130 [Verrucomicrobia bacterium]|nr:MAG: hypothetical protein A2X46_14180 [Lentisphaerae bacterium GWF2_57_35]HBA84833.1 hypothetical protein [Verrucomicrobiota bacterium]
MKKCLILVGVALVTIASRAWAGEPMAVLLEKGIYAEETAGDFDEALRLYQQVTVEAASNQPYAAEAVFRTGMCQLRKGNKAEAVASFENVAANFSAQTGLIEKAKAQLAELNWAPLELAPAPWQDGEILHYNQLLHSGVLGGVEKWMIKADKLGDQDVWRIEELHHNFGPGYRQYVRVEADRDTMIPIESHYEQGVYGTFDVRYQRGKIQLKGEANNKTVSRDIAAGGVAYDLCQAQQLIRRLPLTNGCRQKFYTFYAQDDRCGQWSMEVKAREKVSVPAGDFDCYRVEYSTSGWGSYFTLWVSADEHRYIVKSSYFRSEDAMLELASITHEPQRQFFKNGKPDFDYVSSRQPMRSLEEIQPIVQQAVSTISTCAENDPRVAKALETLKGPDEENTLKALAPFLSSDQATIRRSAIFMVWQGGFSHIEPVLAKLQDLCGHSEDLTRGMAALALGAHQAGSSFDLLAAMATKDASGYARRCAAYALGALGMESARPVLEKASTDSDPLVAGNARTALKALSDSLANKNISEPR